MKVHLAIWVSRKSKLGHGGLEERTWARKGFQEAEGWGVFKNLNDCHWMTDVALFWATLKGWARTKEWSLKSCKSWSNFRWIISCESDTERGSPVKWPLIDWCFTRVCIVVGWRLLPYIWTSRVPSTPRFMALAEWTGSGRDLRFT
jgi:hypothetical protein